MLLANFGQYLEMWRGHQVQLEHIRIFYLALQTWFGIASGQVQYSMWTQCIAETIKTMDSTQYTLNFDQSKKNEIY